MNSYYSFYISVAISVYGKPIFVDNANRTFRYNPPLPDLDRPPNIYLCFDEIKRDTM